MNKLFYVANIRMPTEKAHGIQIIKMCEAFAKEGKEVELIVPNRTTKIKDDPFTYYNVENKFKITRLWSLDLIFLGKVGFYIQALTFSKRVSMYLFFKKGIFYTRDEIVAFYLRLINKSTFWEVHMGQQNLFASLSLKMGVKIIVITEALKDLYIKKFIEKDKILVAPDAYDPKEFDYLLSKESLRKELNLPIDRTIISYIGKYKTMGLSKGVENIIPSFIDLYKKDSSIFLLIVGPEEKEKKEFVSLFDSVKIPQTSYKILTHVNHLEAPKYMKASDILLMVYPNTTHYAYYMSPLKLFEYMASGAAIIASDLPSLREILNDSSCFFFNPDDQRNFNRVLSEAIFNKELRKIKAEEAYENVQKHTWNKRAKNILEFIK